MGEVIGKLFIDINTAYDGASNCDFATVCSNWTSTSVDSHVQILSGQPFEFSSNGMSHIVFLLLAYGFVLYNASSLISNGSELLLLVPAMADIVGSVVLPVLGAVPDGAIVLFSAMGSVDKIKQTLAVGVGALAGSTIFLLTLPWAISVWAGRVSLDESGVGNYTPARGDHKLREVDRYSLRNAGVNCTPIKKTGYIMVITLVPYLLIQGIAFGSSCGTQQDDIDGKCKPSSQSMFALAGTVYCMVWFVLYLYYQVRYGSEESASAEKVDQVCAKAIRASMVSFTGLFKEELRRESELQTIGAEAGISSTPVNKESRVNTMLSRFFAKYDVNKDGQIDIHELTQLLLDLNEDPKLAQDFMTALDSDRSGKLSFDEFCAAMRSRLAQGGEPSLQSLKHETSGFGAAFGAADDDEFEDVMPDDLANLAPAEQQKRIIMRSAWMLTLGTGLVLAFSDPMVDALTGFGYVIGVPPFYVAFVLAPLASNASEILSAYQYACKRTRATLTISLSTLQGAACMNNTFCLGIFLSLLYFKGIAWEYSAETLSIVLVEVAMAYYSLRTTFRVLDGLIILSLFPASLIFVSMLENAGLN